MAKSPEDVERARVRRALFDVRDIIGTGRFTRGEVAGILAALLAHALCDGVGAEEREGLLQLVVGMVRQLWADVEVVL